MASEQFSLCWDNFHKNMSVGMNSLLENEEMVDVTLAVEGKTLKAHKMVLSVCSPYFKELFKSNPCQHPIVFMKDVSYVAISDLLQFMYQGEVQVSQENLTTFIKTAEALQIKGLTGDGNGSGDCDLMDAEPEEKITKIIEHKPGPKSKKHSQTTTTTSTSSSSSSPAPATKRPRLSSQTDTTLSSTITTTKTEVATPTTSANNSNSTTTADYVQFKMEPYEQAQSFTVPDDSGEDNFGDDTIDDSVDDTEDYALMESTDEPQAGTSMDGAGEGQDYKQDNWKQRTRNNHSIRTKFIFNGFVYHTNVVAGDPPFRYLGCADHRKSGCRGRAKLPVDGTIDQLSITQPHNHPPNLTAGEKDTFIKELRKALVSSSMEKMTIKMVYETIADLYPKGAAQVPLKSITSSMHRWRKWGTVPQSPESL